MTQPRVAITGIGLVSSAGGSVSECWTNITAGRSGIRRNTLFDTSEMLTGWAGQVVTKLDQETDRCYALATTAFAEALDGVLDLERVDRSRVGLVVGSSLGAMAALETVNRDLVLTGELDERTAASSQLHCVADMLAETFGIRGPRVVTSNACAASAVAVSFAAEWLWHNDADYVICGGVDPLAEFSANGFTSLGALDPEPCSPMSASTGLTIGEGAAFLVLERVQGAQQRGVSVLAEFGGYGLTCDGFHQTAPDPSGDGAAKSIREALRTAGLQAQQIDYVNLHGTGTPTNDSVEPKALRTLFGTAELPPTSSTKSMLGHTLGAAGAVELICAVKSIETGTLPPTINTRGLPAAAGLDLVPDVGRPGNPAVVLSNSFAFGGNNASLIITEPDNRDPALSGAPSPGRTVVVTGVGGVVGSAGSGDQIGTLIDRGAVAYDSHEMVDRVGEVTFGRADLRTLTKGINPARARRMDPLSVLAAAAVNDLYRRHGKPSRQVAEETGVIFGTGYGPVTAMNQFHTGVVKGGTAAANPLIFPNTVVNAAAGHLAMLNRYRGYTATIACGGTSSVVALQLAHRVIARGAADRIVVVIADEFPEIALRTFAQLPGNSRSGVARPGSPDADGAVFSEGAAAILLEAEDVARRDGTPVLASVGGFGLTGEPVGVNRLGPDGEAWSRSFGVAMAEAGLSASDVDVVYSAAPGRRSIDRLEERALRLAGLSGTQRVAPKGFLGETFGSAGALGLVACLADTSRQESQTVLLSSFAHGGSFATAVLRTV